MKRFSFSLVAFIVVCGCQPRYGSGNPSKLYALAREVGGESFATAQIVKDTIVYYDDVRNVLKKSPLPADVVNQMRGQVVLNVERNSGGILFALERLSYWREP